ncbi:ABC transporter substrate-binding protein [Futiania mangrovi]|uniref:Extracellular solute-binding protein n=1 Tax=Futiania mangrovi TaxID=2959716 RepID=A0A9J6PAM5_9PROT|nr:extracellular solute-binding protein [Futiania mangrovii]MCP1337148.1 extracellular solute-binding protein [Futiania mangrovii]
MNITRRGLIAGIAAVPAVGLAGRLAAQNTKTIRVASWGGSWRDSYVKNIVQRIPDTSIGVEFVLGNPDDNLAKQIAASRQGLNAFEVMEYTPAQASVLDGSDIFMPLDYDQLPAARDLPGWARTPTAVATQFTVDGIVYNKEKFAELGIEPPQRHADLIDERLAGHVAFPDIANGAHWAAIVGLAGGNESDLSPALELVKKMNPAYFFSGSTDLATRFGSGEIWAAPWQSSWALRLRRSGAPVAVSYPKIGEKTAALWPLKFAILKGASSPEAAHAFINTALTAEAQYGHGSVVGQVPVNPEARARMMNEPELASVMLLKPEQIENAYRIDWTKLDQTAWRDRWNRQMSR